MKKLYYLIVLVLILGLVLTGCSLLSNVGQVPTTEQSGIAYLTKGTPETITLYAGQDIEVGTVSVWNDGDYLHVKYDTIGGWKMTETHLEVVTDPEDFPTTNKGNPKVGHFPYGDKNIFTDTWEEIIELSVISAGAAQELYIAAHAVVVKLKAIEGCWEEVWQIGDVEEIVEASGDPGWTGLSNYADEFNWGSPADSTTKGLSLVDQKPYYAIPFIVGTTPTNEFPFNSNSQDPYTYATDFNVEWEGALPFGGRLIISWSPGASALETKKISGDGIATESFSILGEPEHNEGWFLDLWLLEENSVAVSPLTYEKHIINFQHTRGNGSYWDWIRLEKPCEQEETAWAGTEVGEIPFPGANWATYFTYTHDGCYILDITAINGNDGHTHYFTISYNPDTELFTGTGTGAAGDETLSDIELDGNEISFKSVYTGGYTWYPSFELNDDGSLTFIDGHGLDNVHSATGTWEITY